MLHEGLTKAIDAVSDGVISVPNGDAWRVIQALELLRRCVAGSAALDANRDQDRIRFGLEETLKCLGDLWVHHLAGVPVPGALACAIWEDAVSVAWCVLREDAPAAIRAAHDMTEVPRG